jgi:signal transduction histidine kinase
VSAQVNRKVTTGQQEVLEALPEIILQVDSEQRIRTVNRPGASIFSCPPVLGRYLGEFLDEKASASITGLLEEAHQTGIANAEYVTDTEVFRITVKPLQSSSLTLIYFENITSARHAEKALMELVRDKSNFLASVSHELRTPLTAVIGYAALLSEPNTGRDEGARSAMVQDMTDQAWDLAGIVEDLLAVARAEIGGLNVVAVPVNLRANVAQVIESMGTEGRVVTVTGDREITGVGDPARFRQIVRNLLRNALVHGSPPITIEIVAGEAHAALRVTDQGQGVPDELADSIFAQYVTGNQTDAPGRLGVGLWISRELATLMGGQITYQRNRNETTFQATIPLQSTGPVP